MKRIEVRQSIRIGWQKFMERPWYFFGLSLAVTALFVVTSGNAAASVLSSIVYAGFLLSLLKHYDGKKIEFDDIFLVDARWIYFAFLMLIKGIAILIGLLLLIVPGVYLALRWMYAELLVLDKGMKPIEALRESSRLAQGNMWGLFRFSLLASLILIAGFVLLIIGVIPASVIATFALIHMYREVVSA